MTDDQVFVAKIGKGMQQGGRVATAGDADEVGPSGREVAEELCWLEQTHVFLRLHAANVERRTPNVQSRMVAAWRSLPILEGGFDNE